MAPSVSPLVVWLGSAESRDVTGKVIRSRGRHHPGRRGLGAWPAGGQGREMGSGGGPSSATCWPGGFRSMGP